MAVALEVRDRAARGVDRQLGEVGAAQALELGVEVGEVAALEQRVVAEVDARDHVVGAEGDLLVLGEHVVDVAVEGQPRDDAHRQDLLGDDLGGVEDVEVELVGEGLVEDLDAEVPLREVAAVDRGVQVAAVEVGVGAVDLERLVPHHRLHALARLPVELHEGGVAVGVDEAVGVDAEALHEAERARDRAVAHRPQQHVRRLRHQRHEVPEGVVGRGGLGPAAVLLLLDRVDEVGELRRVLDEEDRDVVADEVPVALLGVHLHREPAHVAGEVGGSEVAGDGREPDERLGLLALASRRAPPG